MTGTSTTCSIAASRRDAETPANSGSLITRPIVASYGVSGRSAAEPINTRPTPVRTIVAMPDTPSVANGPYAMSSTGMRNAPTAPVSVERVIRTPVPRPRSRSGMRR